MVGKALHKFDLDLCGHTCYVIHTHMADRAFARFVKKLIDPRILEHIKAIGSDVDTPCPRLLLNEQELLDLMFTFDDIRFDRYWEPYEALCNRGLLCAGEIREELADKYAREWAHVCAESSKYLDSQRTRLSKAISVVIEWTSKARELLKALGASKLLPCPEGDSPTPTCSRRVVAPPVETTGKLAEHMEDLRGAIAKHTLKDKAKANELLKAAGISQSPGRKALRELEKLGEYHGFARKRPRRYKGGKGNAK